jgi:DNA-directed RNA polymerase specialized sigma24 family protein
VEHSNQNQESASALKLADVLYAGNAGALVAESEWIELVRSIAARKPHSLHGLFERSHKIVYTLALQITGDRTTADDVTVDVFHDVWRQAFMHDPEKETVTAWVMNLARSRSLDRLGTERRSKPRKPPYPEAVVELRPSASVWKRLESRIWADTGQPALLSLDRSPEPAWREVASGIFCKLLATDTERDRVSMLVRLVPGKTYPAHRHAGHEELHLLHGELMIDDRKVYPGDYYSADPGTRDGHVWTETGCSCVLITSIKDELC